MENTQELTQGQALNVLIQGVRIAQAKGAFTLEDAELVSRAVKVFVPEQAEASAETEAEDPIINQEDETPATTVVEKVQ